MTGAELIAAERMRQIEEEGWTPQHDATHFDSEMAYAAMCYIDNAIYGIHDSGGPPTDWPWEPNWWKPSGSIRDLVKAGALIAAEIDRLQSCED